MLLEKVTVVLLGELSPEDSSLSYRFPVVVAFKQLYRKRSGINVFAS